MNLQVPLENVLFLDIETVPLYESWNQLSDEQQYLFEKKTAYQRKEDISAEDFYGRAGIWAEFGKIVCISVAFLNLKETHNELRVTSFASENESDVLIGFKDLLTNHFSKKQHVLCAHNGKEFDFPFIARRMIINQIELPSKLNLFGKKPWEVPHLDTMELWKFGDYKHYTSLQLLTSVFEIPSPKDDMDGSDVANTFYKEKNLKKIVAYCEKDAISVAQLLLRFNNQDLVKEEHIISI